MFYISHLLLTTFIVVKYVSQKDKKFGTYKKKILNTSKIIKLKSILMNVFF